MTRVLVFLLALAVLGQLQPAWAQTSTTGAIAGRVTDQATGDGIAGVTIVATSPSLQGAASVVSAEGGTYRFAELPPGSYLVTFYFASLQVVRHDVGVALGQTTALHQAIDLSSAVGSTHEIFGEVSTIDTTSTHQGARITQDYMQNIPIPGRTLSSSLGLAAGSAGDAAGVGFSGSTSLENQYVIDGVNTTGLTYGTVGTPLINEFIDEIQVITGGYQAEYGRATGAVVNAVTKSGSNEFHGSAFATIVPYQVERTPVRQVQSSIDGTIDLDYSADFGFDLGGPIVKDKVWFYVGFAPQIVRNNVTRTVQRRVDCHRVLPTGELSQCDPDQFLDGSPDEDPFTGDLLFEPVDRRQFKTIQQAYQWVSKINFAHSSQHQGQVSLVGTPVTGQGIFGVNGAEGATRADYQALTTDVAAKWSSKFHDNKTEVELLAGWHRDKYDQDSLDKSVLDTPTTRAYFFNLGRVGQAGNESSAALYGCTDTSTGTDPYPAIENCPLGEYWLDSPGFTIDNLEDRRGLSGKLTRRIDGFGSHVVKVGADVEDNRTVDVRHFTGGRYYQLINEPYSQVRVYRYVAPEADGAGDVCGFETDLSGSIDFDMPRRCEYLDRAEVTGQTVNWSAFAQDSWQIQPNLTLNAGLRYEEQRLRYAEHLRGSTDPFTMEPIGNNAITLSGMLAPRVGLLYDFTREGRSKVYGSYGRFYESIPMALNDFSFSGTTLYGAFFDFSQCAGSSESPDAGGLAPSPYDCPTDINQDTSPVAGEVYRGGTTLVAPGTRAQYMDEVIVGSEYEVLEDLTVGAAVKRRSLGRVLEDMSIDGADTYIIGNPGQFDEGAERELLDSIAGLPEGSSERNLLESRLESFRALRRFESPRRDYHAVELTAIKRISRGFFVQGSYTLSRTSGNYPGLLNGDTGAALPNVSTQYDFAELLANRDGVLPQDRTHYFKLDSYYTFAFEDQGDLTAGIRFRAFSGTPRDALAGHYLYGFGEVYLLPRGDQGRTPFVTGTDLHLSYARTLARNYRLSAFLDIINFFNQEQVFQSDELYTFDFTNPVVGGEYRDLVFAKAQNQNGIETSQPLSRNIGYSTPLSRYVPLFIRVGARLSF